ncbi:MAG TPA: metalloregulator ArsR/SmtB family transcription factor [Candidatus Dormibacteraeota bacterium]|jgi:ArsR family transcriptional regulator, cadmium/lead-responsive transcriptional repressor|nr:metalloregulator ArsR/SmtB family transcription factor [Candidatus Dormibacteraeota bacterium]
MFLQSPRHELPDHFLALANPTRLRILQRLGAVGEESVNDLAAHLRMSQPRISWHLRMLRLGGVIRTRREGRMAFCSLDVENIARERVRLDQLLGIKEKERVKVREEVGA